MTLWKNSLIERRISDKLEKENRNKRTCWYNPSSTCFCNDDSDCFELRLSHAKLLYCNDDSCMFNISLPFKHFVNRGRNHKPFEDDGFTGVCGRDDVGFAPRNITVDRFNKKFVVSCRVRSDKSLNRPHLPDPDKLEGGSYPEPTDPHAAFHG